METCQWIIANNPHYTASRPAYSRQAAASLARFPIDTAWFQNPLLIDSLHGLRHLYRTAYFCMRLLEHTGTLDSEDSDLIIVAALLHDIQRLDDKADEGHASRSALWVISNLPRLSQTWNLKLNAEHIAKIEAVIALHETPYNSFSPEQQHLYTQHKSLVDILKTADALDRYRLPKLTWWPDDKHLALIPPKELKQEAYQLVAASELSFLKGVGSGDSVINITKGHHA
ncbi:MAG TPA: HD domain-containing protein [Bacillota bacterium]|nr:HD domain-containing protein [Bacillota bacterium]